MSQFIKQTKDTEHRIWENINWHIWAISKNHTKKGFELMFDSGYGGEHWL